MTFDVCVVCLAILSTESKSGRREMTFETDRYKDKPKEGGDLGMVGFSSSV